MAFCLPFFLCCGNFFFSLFFFSLSEMLKTRIEQSHSQSDVKKTKSIRVCVIRKIHLEVLNMLWSWKWFSYGLWKGNLWNWVICDVGKELVLIVQWLLPSQLLWGLQGQKRIVLNIIWINSISCNLFTALHHWSFSWTGEICNRQASQTRPIKLFKDFSSRSVSRR